MMDDDEYCTLIDVLIIFAIVLIALGMAAMFGWSVYEHVVDWLDANLFHLNLARGH